MSRNTTILLAVVLLVLGGWYFLSSQKTQAPSTAPQASPQEKTEATNEGSMKEDDEEVMEKITIEITSSGFMPKNITIKVSEAVTWNNTDSADHTVNSAVHPTHQVYPPLNLGVIKSGEKKSLTFPEKGTYKYHDHLNPSLTGSITVE